MGKNKPKKQARKPKGYGKKAKAYMGYENNEMMKPSRMKRKR